MQFGSWVREQRTARRMTQTECAARAGIKLQQWNRMELTVERPLLGTVNAVATGLQMTVQDVLTAALPILSETAMDKDADLLQVKAVLDRLSPARRRQAVTAFVELVGKP